MSRADDLRLRELLVQSLGDEATDKLLERLPLTPVSNFATKDDITALRGEMLDEFGKLRGEFGESRGQFGELRGEFGNLRAELADRMRIQTWYMATLLVSGLGASAAITAAITG